MAASAITRRSLLAGAAGAMAAGLTRPAGVLAQLAGPSQPVLEDRWLGRLAADGLTVELKRRADLVGLEWRAPASARVELRFRGVNGRWSDWASGAGCAQGHAHGPDSPAADDRFVGAPLWTGGTTAVQLRASQAMSGVRLHLVDVSDGVGAHRQAIAARSLAFAAALPTATPVGAGAGQPAILARQAWAQGVAHPAVTPAYGAVRMAFVHHTENPNGYTPGEVPAMLRAIFAFHRFVNGWNDIGYNFVVDSYGRVFEARAGGIDEPVVGAHAGGYNLVSTGVAVLGSFISQRISPAAQGALERLLAWKLSLHGVPAEGHVTVRVNPAGAFYSRYPANARVSLPRIAGHRDGDSTDCPGDVLYGELASMREGVRRLAPRPATATLALAPAALAPASGTAAPSTGAPAASAPASGARALTGVLASLDGTPIAGAPVIVQARSVTRRGELVRERTIAEVTTDAQGRWFSPASFYLPPPRSGGAWLRAMCPGVIAQASPGVGATVSDPLRVALSAPLSSSGAPLPTP